MVHTSRDTTRRMSYRGPRGVTPKKTKQIIFAHSSVKFSHWFHLTELKRSKTIRTSWTHHALALPDIVQCLLCLLYGFLSSVLYCYGGISQNASSINLRHFVSVRRSRNFGRARKTASKIVSKNWCGSGRRARARSRLGIWYRGNGMIMLRKAIYHVRYINILTWLRGFQDKLLSICCCFLCVQVSFGNSEEGRKL